MVTVDFRSYATILQNNYAAILYSNKESGWLRTSTIASGRRGVFGVVISTHTYRVENPSDRFREALTDGYGAKSEEEAACLALRQVNAIDDLDFASGIEFAIGAFNPAMTAIDLTWIGKAVVFGIAGNQWQLINAPHLMHREHEEISREDFVGRFTTRSIAPSSLDAKADRRSVDLTGFDWVVFATYEPESFENDEMPRIPPSLYISPGVFAASIANAWIDEIHAEISVVAINVAAARAKLTS